MLNKILPKIKYLKMQNSEKNYPKIKLPVFLGEYRFYFAKIFIYIQIFMKFLVYRYAKLYLKKYCSLEIFFKY